MRDRDCVDILQWCLPQLGLRWAGFRKVRGTVCKRVARRMRELRLDGADAYKVYLAENADEWRRLDAFCRIPISRFYRDRAVYDALSTRLLPGLAGDAAARADRTIRCWSAGCASGEEPYTLAILWHCRVRQCYPDVRIDIVATDADPVMLERAAKGCYAEGSLRALPADLRDAAFVTRGDRECVRDDVAALVRFQHQDIRETMPPGPFDLILCRNLVLTYFDAGRQRAILRELAIRLRAGGLLIIGAHEEMPPDVPGFSDALDRLPVYRRLHDAPQPVSRYRRPAR